MPDKASTNLNNWIIRDPRTQCLFRTSNGKNKQQLKKSTLEFHAKVNGSLPVSAFLVSAFLCHVVDFLLFELVSGSFICVNNYIHSPSNKYLFLFDVA